MTKKVSQIIFGCAPLGVYDMGDVNLKEVMRCVEEAYNNGITTFDCADIYGLGEAENNLSRALGKNIKNAHIITKFGIKWKNYNLNLRAETSRDCSADYMEKALHKSLKRLKVERIDTYFVHWPDGKTSIEEISNALENIKRAGKIGSYGFSNFPISEVIAAVKKGVTFPEWIQAECNLLSEQNYLEDLKEIRRYNVKTMVYGTLAQGYLTGKFKNPPIFKENDRRSRMSQFQPHDFSSNELFLNKLESISKTIGLSMTQTATSWCFKSGFADAAIVGINKLNYLQEFLIDFNNDLFYNQIKSLNNIRNYINKNPKNNLTSHKPIT